ncbi:Haloacid dehalogenase-like hydrolase [Dillenia turbinata]|uniref:riboflavin kinase n=1 Tax=Dillenia turbinata TaxID=194707 RepID=A0AAN8VSE5_9MAGN
MSIAMLSKKLVSCVILDLDGTLLNTDGVVTDVLKAFLVKLGRQWDAKAAHKIVGRTPYEAAAIIVQDYGLQCTTEDFISEINPLFSDQIEGPNPNFGWPRWCNIKPLPGAERLLKHLRCHDVPMALASNSPRVNVESKISFHPGWKESFSAIVAGDDVRNGKPSPDIYFEAAKRLNVEPSNCLVIEDSLPGVSAGKAAGMEVVAVPSLPKQHHLYTSADEVINSLLDLQPEKWGLPPFQDCNSFSNCFIEMLIRFFSRGPFNQTYGLMISGINGTLPLEPWHIGGPVIKGYGRGSKVLGIPTANLSTEGYAAVLSEHPSGVYFGWAGLSTRGIYKMVMSIGWNPYFNNVEKTIEPWLLHSFDEDFYGEELHLTIVGYIRPEANFSSLESLIARIHEDGRIAERALDLPIYSKSKYKDDPYLGCTLPADKNRL